MELPALPPAATIAHCSKDGRLSIYRVEKSGRESALTREYPPHIGSTARERLGLRWTDSIEEVGYPVWLSLKQRYYTRRVLLSWSPPAPQLSVAAQKRPRSRSCPRRQVVLY
ncbi:hypothetical protein ON010_g4029 [Phytophthora cinnamomi]|nr:hypothetical protein ON010_g4029 [Phytophthora cinnamomi]